MKSDPNFLVIRIPRMYAEKVQDLSLGRIVGEAIRLLGLPEEIDDATLDNLLELTSIKDAVDAFSSAVREGLTIERDASLEP